MNPVRASILSLLRPSRKRVVGGDRAARSDADTPGFALAVATFFGARPHFALIGPTQRTVVARLVS